MLLAQLRPQLSSVPLLLLDSALLLLIGRMRLLNPILLPALCCVLLCAVLAVQIRPSSICCLSAVTAFKSHSFRCFILYLSMLLPGLRCADAAVKPPLL